MPGNDRPVTTPVRLVFADEGAFHSETVQVPLAKIGQYERLLDLLHEEPSVTRQMFVDMKRLVAAWVVEEEA